ncbi:actin cytoskeleton and mitosis protein [Oleoguttula sp. CCFEE 5521]
MSSSSRGLRARGTPRGMSNARGRGVASRGSISRGGFGAASGLATTSSRAAPVSRGDARTNGNARQPSKGNSVASTRGTWPERYEKLERARKVERTQAIQNGEIQDPDKPRALSEAITPIGKCMDMCAEYERVERVVQKDIWAEETDPNTSAYTTLDREPDEARMVKKFRRSAAGIEEQLPSDLRPPPVLQKTCDYLFNEVIGNAADIAKVHHFVWDRTRAIRNDFSIQQISDAGGLRIAIDCYERIARFHILSLHQLALPEPPYDKYDWQQEREQLDRTLLSLVQYYDDSRGKVELVNEAEFRSYLIIFQLQDPIPDLEDRVQTWSPHIVQHPRVRKALRLYAAACNTKDLQGPLKPGSAHVIAQQDWQRFWILLQSPRTSYLTACVAEIYFNMIRSMALQGLLRSSNQRSLSGEYTADEMISILALDNVEELETFCGSYGITLTLGTGNERNVDFSSLKGRQTLPNPVTALPKQMKTDVVEAKRFGRSFPAVINGMSVKDAQGAGLLIQEEDDTMGDIVDNGTANARDAEEAEDGNAGDSLFMPETATHQTKRAPQPQGFLNQNAPFGSTKAPATESQVSPFSFGQPATAAPVFGAPSTGSNLFPTKTTDSTTSGSKFNFLTPAAKEIPVPAPSATSNGFNFTAAPAHPATAKPAAFGGFSFASSVSPAADQKPSGSTLFAGNNGPSTQNQPTPSFSFGQSTAKPSGPFVEEGADDTTTAPSSSPDPATPHPAASGFSFSQPAISSPFSFATTTPDTGRKPLPTFDFATPAPAKSAAHVPAAPEVPSNTPDATPKSRESSLKTSPAPPSFDLKSTQPKLSTDKSPFPSAGRRSSGLDFSTKPSHPSPLAHSFTANSAITASEVIPPTQQATVKISAPATQQSLTQPSTHQLVKATAVPDFASLLTAVANELTLAWSYGFLDQYTNFVAGRVITDVQEKLHHERITAEADEFRTTVLSFRYGKLWRDICRHNRLRRQGRDKRKRAQQRLAESRSQASETVSLADTRSVTGSRLGTDRQSTMGTSQSRQEAVDRMFQSSVLGRRSTTAGNGVDARGGSKRPTSSHGPGGSTFLSFSGHKRLKSTSHVDGNGRVAKPGLTPRSDPQQAAFLASLSGPPPTVSTTRTNYFRLKAAGYSIAPGAAKATPALKRTHGQMSQSSLASTNKAPSALGSIQSTPASAERSLIRRPSTGSGKSAKINEEDEALFARLKAARERLNDTAPKTTDDADQPASLGKSHGSLARYESPSLVKARADARLKLSQSTSTSEIPAYRLRESKFVPREQYGKAFDRSKELRESRSREGSRPQSIAPSPYGVPANNITSGQPSRTNVYHATPSRLPRSGDLSSSLGVANGYPAKAIELPNSFGHSQPATAKQSYARPSLPTYVPPSSKSQLHAGVLASKPAIPADELSHSAVAPAIEQWRSQLDVNTALPTSQTFPDNESMASQVLDLENGYGNFEPSFAKVGYEDHTIQPSQIGNSLSAPFGPINGHAQPDDSYKMQFAQSNGHKSDYSLVNTHHDDEDEGFSHHQADDLPQSYGHANPFALLANGDDEDEEESGDDPDPMQSSAVPGSYQYTQPQPQYFDDDEHGDTEDDDGDTEDEGQDEEREEYDGSDEEGDSGDDESGEDDEGQYAHYDPSFARRQMPPPAQPDSVLKAVGHTESDAIELSD